MVLKRLAKSQEALLAEESGFLRSGGRTDRRIISAVAIAWALFQLALPRFILLDSITVRAIHLAFAIVLVLLTVPVRRTVRPAPGTRIPIAAYVLAVLAVLAVLYIVLDRQGIAKRPGMPIWRDTIAAVALVVFVLEAARRAIGPALSIIALLFTACRTCWPSRASRS
jgi:TRAP-type uncharacterized transport system fused permease subunit